MFVSKRLSKALRFAALTMCALFLTVGNAFAQNITVTGKVTDKSGEPIVGAYVIVQGTTTGASTDLDGAYSLNAPANGVLEFSSLGYETVAVPVNSRSVVDVTLADDALMLQETVVIGYGTQKKENLTGAVASINTSKQLESRPIADVGRGLQGATPGLNVRVANAEVGSEPIMKIRGQVGSYEGGSAPLILMDNVEIPSINLINPDDIESISILKDAASASIYGAKAAFGVILITTKKGNKEAEKINVTYSGNMAFQNMAEAYEVAGVEGLHYTVEAAERLGTYTPTGAFWHIDRAGYNAAKAWKQKYADLDPYSPMTYGRDWYMQGTSKIGVRTYDPYEYLVRNNAPTQTHNINIAGSKGNTNFNISLGYLDQSGMMKTTDFDKFTRYNANVRVSTKINDWLSVRAGLMYSKKQKSWSFATSSTSADIWYYVYRWGPTYPLVPNDEYGNNLRTAAYETSVGNKATKTNMYSSANVGVTLTPVKNWNIDFDYNYATNTSSEYNPGTILTGGNTWVAGAPVAGAPDVQNEWNEFNKQGSVLTAMALPVQTYTTSYDFIYQDAYTSEQNTFNATTTYDLNLNDSHKMKFMLGLNAVSYVQTGVWGKKAGLMDITNPQFALATGTQTSGGGHTWQSQLGFFGRINYNFKERYLLEANLRYDGSSKFPTELKWRWFPSFSAGWRVSEEPWMANIKHIISGLKLRGSWGSIGDQSVGNSLYIPTMSRNTGTWFHGTTPDVYYSTPAAVSQSITWQDIVTLDLGLDLSLFNELNITFDWYRRDTKNMIVGAEGLGIGFGTTAPKGNYGSLRTHGWEVAVNYGHMFDNGFSLSATATLADAVTTITEYGTATGISGWYNGKTYGEIWGFEVDRLYQNEDFARDAEGKLIEIKTKDGYRAYQMTDPNAPTQGYLNSGNLIFGPGDVKYKDLNGDGVINKGASSITIIDDPKDPNYGKPNYGDLTVIGNTTPRYEYSFRVDMAWHGVDLGIFFQGVGKRDLWGSSSLTLPGFNSGDGSMAASFANDFWYETIENGKVVDANYDAFYPRAANCGGSNVFNMQTNDRYLLNMAYLRLKNVTLGYTFPAKWMNKANIQKLRIYASLENFLTFDKLNGLPIDPEVIPGYTGIAGDSGSGTSRAGLGTPAFKTASLGLQITF
ncbi:MAG: TonB-dependent receptor [Bacteroidales bacterium]|nr:TonB-dependent receptor [Bacteroidales bacterium]